MMYLREHVGECHSTSSGTREAPPAAADDVIDNGIFVMLIK